MAINSKLLARHLVIFFVLAGLFSVSCSNNSPSDLIVNDESSLRLKWNKAYADDTIEKSAIGLEWAISFLGALLPNSPAAFSIEGQFITITPSEWGLSPTALLDLQKLHVKIKTSGEYQATGAIDLGRYVTLLIGAPEHYYKISGVPKRLEDLMSNYTLTADKGYVNNSEVSLVHRSIQFSQPNNLNQVFLAGEFDLATGEIYEYETVEVIANGQVRFGIFDADGNRKNNATAAYTNAGKPAKCMWCHESSIQGMFSVQNDVTGYLPYQQFQQKLLSFKQNLSNQRANLVGGVDFSQTQQHTLTELLYISFMEPSAERLSLEWGLPLAQVQTILSGLESHIYDEFPFLGQLYDRNAVEDLAPFQGLPVSTSVREMSPVEVNYID